MQIGSRIKSIRESKQMSQKKLADSIHVSPSLINRIEKGTANVSLESVCDIAKALGVTPQDILCDIFVYPEIDEMSVAEQARYVIEKLPLRKQEEILRILEFIQSSLSDPAE